MKVYTGHKTSPGSAYVVVKEGDLSKELTKFDPANHSPDGFQWGYLGGGPACLASSLLKDATGCNCQYQRYKFGVIANLENDWQLTERQIIQKAIEIRRRDGHEDTCHHHPLYKEKPKAGDHRAPF